jgi:hypothetical protein
MRYILKVHMGFMIAVVLQISKIWFSNLMWTKQIGCVDMSFNTKVKLIPGVCNKDWLIDWLIDWLVTVVCVITPFLFDTGYCPFYEMCLYTKNVLSDWSIDTFIIYCKYLLHLSDVIWNIQVISLYADRPLGQP